MIPRYSRPQMSAIWEDDNKLRIWAQIELYACEAMAEIGAIPENIPATLRNRLANVKINGQRVLEIEQTIKHDVIAFLSHLTELIGHEARFLHQGMTSSDVLDTCLAVQLNQASNLLINDLNDLLIVLKRRAIEHKYTIMIGRSHGIHAEPTTFGLKLVRAYAEFCRNLHRIKQAKAEIASCSISGAVGTFANIDPRVELYVAKKLGLSPEPIASQIIPRDRHAMFFATLGVVAASIENLAVEIRHLQRTEVREVEEFFATGQKGSSAMPHKRNPVLSENLTGLCRLIRSHVAPALENVTTWHERDISHSSTERLIAPDTTIALDFALVRLTNIIENLIVYPSRMEQNLNDLKGITNSQRVLLALVDKGLDRQLAYRLVQRAAMKVWDEQMNFSDALMADREITTHLNSSELSKLFDNDYHTKHVDKIMARVFAEYLI